MKRKIIFFSLLLILFNCNRDRDSPEPDSVEKNILGVWIIDKWEYKYGNGSSEIFPYGDCFGKPSTYEFLNNQTVKVIMYMSGGMTICEPNYYTWNYIYDSKNNKLNLNGEDRPILSLTENKLTFIMRKYDYDNDGKEDQWIVYLKK